MVHTAHTGMCTAAMQVRQARDCSRFDHCVLLYMALLLRVAHLLHFRVPVLQSSQVGNPTKACLHRLKPDLVVYPLHWPHRKVTQPVHLPSTFCDWLQLNPAWESLTTRQTLHSFRAADLGGTRCSPRGRFAVRANGAAASGSPTARRGSFGLGR